MLLAIASDKIPLVIAIAAVLVIHYPLAVIATGRIFRYKAKGLPDWAWHIIIQVLFIIGPTIFILLHGKNSRPKVYKSKHPVKPQDETTQETVIDNKNSETERADLGKNQDEETETNGSSDSLEASAVQKPKAKTENCSEGKEDNDGTEK